MLIDKASGKQRGVIDAVDQPRGLAIGPDGRLYVVANTTVVSMKVDGSDRKVLVDDLMDPQRIAVAKNGEFFVSVRGFYQQVRRYGMDGKLINAIGRRGGMVSPGPWVKEAMRRPLGVAIGPDGNVWVTEETMNPKRTSEWKPDGTFVREYDGPVPYSSATVMDPEDPDHVYSENTQFQIDYTTGKTWPTAVIFDDGDHGQDGPVSGGGNTRVIHFQGRTFIAKAGGSIYEMVHDHAVLRVWFGRTHFGPREGWDGSIMGIGIDRNENGKIEPAESELSVVNGGCNWYTWVGDNLDIYLGDTIRVWKLPFEGFDVNGVPNYQMAHAKMLFSRSAAERTQHPGALDYPVPVGAPNVFMVDSQGNMYVAMSAGPQRIKRGQSLLDSGHSIIKISPAGKLLWEYRNVVADMGSSWNTVISKPGEIEGICNFTGEMGRYLTIASYFGQYHVMDKETGLYITAFTPDMRTEPPLNEFAVCAENFNGEALYAKKLNKYLYCGGDADARVWEVQGLDEAKFASFPVSFTSADAERARDNRKIEAGVAPKARLLPARMVNTTAVSANLDNWANAEWATFNVDDQRKGRAAVSWDENTLTVIFDVTDGSPLLNRGGNPELLFKSGDCVDLDLSGADPDAPRPNDQPILGDKRLLVAVVQDGKGGEKPLVMLYEPVSDRKDATPGAFHSPVSSHTFDNVQAYSTPVAFQRRAGGYTLEIQLNAKQLGLGELQMGRRFRADFGALFSDPGGSLVMAKTLWSDDSPEVSVTQDVPTESKIRPTKWGWVVLE